jgi:ketosteroid isomerase-like protein
MIHQNAEIIRGGYDAFARGDIPNVLGMLSEDITWHVPGRSTLSGDYVGHDGVLGFFGKCLELSGGTLKVGIDELLADGERVVVLSTVTAERNGQALSTSEVHRWRVIDGKAIEFCEFQGDQQSEDEFWLS